MKTKRIAIAGMSAALAFGAGTGFLINQPISASAASAQVASVSTPTDPAAETSTDPGRPDPGARFAQALQPLVDAGTITAEQVTGISDAVKAAHDAAEAAGTDHVRGALLTDTLSAQVSAGTLTQGQADAVTTALEAARGQGRGGPGGQHGRRGANLEVAATALGMTAEELKTELTAGNTIADVATAKGVDVQTVIDALVQEATSNITERITNMVNGVKPADAPPTPAADTSTDANG